MRSDLFLYNLAAGKILALSPKGTCDPEESSTMSEGMSGLSDENRAETTEHKARMQITES